MNKAELRKRMFPRTLKSYAKRLALGVSDLMAFRSIGRYLKERNPEWQEGYRSPRENRQFWFRFLYAPEKELTNED